MLPKKTSYYLLSLLSCPWLCFLHKNTFSELKDHFGNWLACLQNFFVNAFTGNGFVCATGVVISSDNEPTTPCVGLLIWMFKGVN